MQKLQVFGSDRDHMDKCSEENGSLYHWQDCKDLQLIQMRYSGEFFSFCRLKNEEKCDAF